MNTNSKASFHVQDMNCEHCVRAITQTIESSVPGTKVAIDLEKHMVTVTGCSDHGRLARLMEDAGYTPQAI